MTFELPTAEPSRFATEEQTARRTALLYSGWARASAIESAANHARINARRNLELKLRLIYRVPYHEYAEALALGRGSVTALLEAYYPSPTARRCPPWATRKYRVQSGEPRR